MLPIKNDGNIGFKSDKKIHNVLLVYDASKLSTVSVL